MDNQVKELLARHWLINELLRAGLEVAAPLRDHGIDLIAYLDVSPILEGDTSAPARFAARPIQMKTVTGERFTVDAKYAKFPDLLLVHIWHAEDPARTVAYGMTYPEMYAIAQARGWTSTKTWASRGGYYNMSAPGKELVRSLEPFRMTPQRWRQFVM